MKLNVGGILYHTTIGTLTKLDNMLRAMFSGRIEVLTDSDGELSEVIIYLFKVQYPMYIEVHVQWTK